LWWVLVALAIRNWPAAARLIVPPLPFLPMTTGSNPESKFVGVFRCRAVETAVHEESDFSGIFAACHSTRLTEQDGPRQ
jgi:hypothetical protein